MPDDPARKIFAAVKVIDYLACQHILHYRVYREIAPSRCSFCPNKRIHIYLKVPVPFPRRMLAARHGYVQVLFSEREYSEAFAEGYRIPYLFEYAIQSIRLYAMHLYIHILIVYSKQFIAYKTADVECSSAGVIDFFSYSFCYACQVLPFLS